MKMHFSWTYWLWGVCRLFFRGLVISWKNQLTIQDVGHLGDTGLEQEWWWSSPRPDLGGIHSKEKWRHQLENWRISAFRPQEENERSWSVLRRKDVNKMQWSFEGIKLSLEVFLLWLTLSRDKQTGRVWEEGHFELGERNWKISIWFLIESGKKGFQNNLKKDWRNLKN